MFTNILIVCPPGCA